MTLDELSLTVAIVALTANAALLTWLVRSHHRRTGQRWPR